MSNWTTICKETDLTPDTGLCALLDGEQVAVFYSKKTGELYAVSNFDPIGEANVLSRGIIGSIGEAVVVASPLYKQHFDLKTGACLEEPEHTLKVYPVRLEAGEVQLQPA
ncbi:MAG: nitrite reductase small subunit NirD [Gammaproteobacteria bacterium]|uniref:nitrite reductase small subunit NirD n=1 Tax=Pseudomaricurvus alcaniphilus TaxID=1166482 RepID=UPI0014095F50|nr:nitrite reductase small subunit NirD [Pseudomaricurvus alcaniphilus]MBR9910972.1 nitrite reductase small subunit NirD [Gammaproteobacteria bacterium]NHN37682.1 nitrite reductase small subunit NirD [Pseudomaricurvus alcaniphilus]